MNGDEENVIIENALVPDVYVTEDALVYENEYEVGKDADDQQKDADDEDDLDEEDEEYGDVEVEEEIVGNTDDDDVNDDSSNIKLETAAEEVIVANDLDDYDDNQLIDDDDEDEDDELGDSDEREMVVDEKAIDDDESQSQSMKQENLDELNEKAEPSNSVTSQDNLSSGEPNGKDGSVNQAPHEAWSHFTGLKVKHFTQSELEAFKKPFEMGWKREVVLRGTVTNSGKKIGDVYYFSPDKKVKLRSYVEMGLYLKKHQNCELEPENFTFARQPIYKAPEEIVRHAMQRGGNHANTQQSNTPANVNNNNNNNSNTSNTNNAENVKVSVIRPKSKGKSSAAKQVALVTSTPTNNVDHNFAAVEPRSKRKRVAPTRFEDEDYSDQTAFKKRPKMDKLNILAAAAAAAASSVTTTPEVTVSTPAVTSATSLTLQTPLVNKTPHMKVTLSNKASLLVQPTLFSKKGQTILQVQSQPSQHLVVTGIQQIPVTISSTTTATAAANTQPNEEKSTAPAAPIVKSQQPVQHNYVQLNKNDQLVAVQSNSMNTSTSTSSASSPSSLVTNPTIIKKANNPGKVPVLKIKMSNFKTIKPKVEQDSENSQSEMKVDKGGDSSMPTLPVAPCSIMCNGRRGTLPSLLCTRCLCLFHPECVATGLNLKEPNQFVCPNCIQPGERESQSNVNGNQSSTTTQPSIEMNGNSINDNDSTQSDKLTAKVLNKSRAFQPILPKPNGFHMQNRQSTQQTVGHSQLSFVKSLTKDTKHLVVNTEQLNGNETVKKFLSSQQVKVKLPAGTHLYRVPGPKAHQESIAPRGFKGLINNSAALLNRKNVNQLSSSGQNYSFSHHLKLQQQQHQQQQQQQQQSQMVKSSSSSNLNSSKVSAMLSHPLFKQLMSTNSSTSSSNLKNVSQRLQTNQQQHNQHQLQQHQQRSHKNQRNYKEYLRKRFANLNTLTDHYKCLTKILENLTVRDLLRMRQVSRTFNNLVTQTPLWQKISLKGLKILDWQYLGRNIVEPHCTTEVNFENIRCSQTDLVDVWRNFASLIDYFKSVRVLKFGTIPTFVIEEIVNAAITENCYNSFVHLEAISVKNLINEDDKKKPIDINILTNLSYIPSLKSLSIDCRQGLVVNCEKSFNNFSKTLSSLCNLKALILPCLRGLSVEQFSFLKRLTNLEHLEIGSCESWATFDENESSLEEQLADDSKSINKDDETMVNSSTTQESESKALPDVGDIKVVEATNDITSIESNNINNANGDGKEDKEIPMDTTVAGEVEVNVIANNMEKKAEAKVEDKKEKEKQLLEKIISEKQKPKGAFKYLKDLTKLKKLKLVDVIIDESSNQWSNALKEMKELKSLSLETVTISPDATETLDYLCKTMKQNLIELTDFQISTNDSHTNKCVYEFIKKLRNLNKIVWKVGALVEDSGQCLVPFLKERGDESDMEGEDLTSGEDHVEMMDMSLLSDILHVALPNTTVIILPQ